MGKNVGERREGAKSIEGRREKERVRRVMIKWTNERNKK
jgi:hypothetical protein